ncbi:MAG: ABC transporter permease subunit [Spirochaetales bacterium]|nr:ABC transporter permease subunit [Spirochaetales bacterium]
MTTSEAKATARRASRAPAIVAATASLLIPGLGQLLNRQRLKALLWFAVPVLLVSVELATSDWGRYAALLGGRVPEESFAKGWIAEPLLEGAVGGEQAASLADLFGSADASAEGEDPFAAAAGEDPFAAAAEEDPFAAAAGEDPFAAAAEEDPFAAAAEDLDPFAAAAEEDPFAAAAADLDPFALAAADFDPFAEAAVEGGDEGGDSYFDATYVWPDYPEEGPRYVVRDFGGFFTRGLWGLSTLGRLVIEDAYAGTNIELYNKVTPWLGADNSIVLMGNGLIALSILVIFAAVWAFGVADAYRSRVRTEETGRVEKFTEFWGRVWHSLYVYLVSAPAFVLMILFTIIPILFTFLMAFTNYTYRIKLGAKLIEWVGLDTFRFLAVDPGWLSVFGQIFLWTILWAIMSSFTVYALGFINAMVVESPLVRGKKVWRTIMILPWAIPSLVSLMVFRNAFDKDGLVNQFLFASGLMEPVTNFLYKIGLAGKPDMPIFWFQPIYNGALARFVVVLTNLWLGAPYHMMMIIGVLATVPKELYEAAAIDGATSYQRFRYITLPMVLSATVPALIMTFSFNFNNFGAVYFLTGGGPSWDPSKVPDSMRIVGSAMPGQTDILISWIYKLSFTKDFEQYNTAAVYSIIIFMIVGGFAVFNMLRSKSFTEEAGE